MECMDRSFDSTFGSRQLFLNDNQGDKSSDKDFAEKKEKKSENAKRFDDSLENCSSIER